MSRDLYYDLFRCRWRRAAVNNTCSRRKSSRTRCHPAEATINSIRWSALVSPDPFSEWRPTIELWSGWTTPPGRIDHALEWALGVGQKSGGQWRKCEDPSTAGYTPGAIEQMKDLNGDGRPEAVITEGSTFCFGITGVVFNIVSKQANGSWRLVASRTGIATFLATKGAGGWPDVEIGGPGMCFPVERWNGREYVIHRRQYEGRPCRR